MALARGTIIKPVEFNLPVLQFPSELAYSQAVTYQSEKDMYDALAQTTPKARSVDEPWRQEYTKYVQDLSETVTQAFATGNTDLAMKALRKAKTNVQDMWRPGGLANALEEAALTEASEIARLQEAHKDDPTGAGNLMFALKRFKQAQQPLNYDYDTGKYNRVGQAENYNYVDIPDEMISLAKEVDPDLVEQDFVDGSWITKIKTKEVPADRLQALWDGFVSRPEVMSQLEVGLYNQYGIDFNDIDVDFRKLDWANLTPEDAKKVERIQMEIDALKGGFAKTKEVYNSMSVEDKQQHLKDLGFYKGNVDGDFKKLSKEAEQRYLKYLDDSLSKDVTRLQTNPKSYFLEEVAAAPHRQTFYNLFGREYSKTLEANPYGLANYKASLAIKVNEAQFKLTSAYNQQQYENANIVQSQATDALKVWTSMRTDIEAAKTTTEDALNKLLMNPTISTALGVYSNDPLAKSKAVDAMKIFSEALLTDNPQATFIQRYQATGASGDASKIFNVLSAEGGRINDMLRSSAEYEMRLNQMAKQEGAIYKEVDKGQLYKENKRFVPAGTTEDEFYEMVAKASTMSSSELMNDPKMKGFYVGGANMPGAISVLESNKAKSIRQQMENKIVSSIEEGHMPKSMVGYTLTSNENWGVGALNDDLTIAIKTAPSDFMDVVKNNNTKWTNQNGEPTAVTRIDFEGAKVAFGIYSGMPAIKLSTKTGDTYMLKVPEKGSNMYDKSVSRMKEEWAVAVNKGDMPTANRFAGILVAMGINDDDYINQAIRVNNDNAATETVRYKGANLEYAHTVVDTRPVSTPVGTMEYKIITWNDAFDKPRYGIVYNDALLGPPALVEVAPGHKAVIFNPNTKTIQEATYDSYTDALSALQNAQLATEINVEQTLQKLPKNTPAEFGNQRTQQYSFTAELMTEEELQ